MWRALQTQGDRILAVSRPPREPLRQPWGREGVKQSESSIFCSRQSLLALKTTRPVCKASWIRGGSGTCGSTPKLLLEVRIRCNTARAGSKFLQALRSQSPPGLASSQVLPGNATRAEGTECVFSAFFNCISPLYYSMRSAVHIKLSPSDTPRKNEMHRDVCHVKIASLESRFHVLMPGSYLQTVCVPKFWGLK